MWVHENDDAPTSGMSAPKNPAKYPASPEQAAFLRQLAKELVSSKRVKAVALPGAPLLRWDYPTAAFIFDLPRSLGQVEFQRTATRVVLYGADTEHYPACAGYQG